MVASLHRSIDRERVPNVRNCGERGGGGGSERKFDPTLLLRDNDDRHHNDDGHSDQCYVFKSDKTSDDLIT